ncbi:MAG: acyl-CoA dehydrogenase family protein [Candidatus Obscuribacterales bacterium]
MTNSDKETSFAETAMRLSGKSEEEATRTGAVDRADDEVEALFAAQYKTVNSPVHRAVWDNSVPLELFAPPRAESAQKNSASEVMEKSLAILAKHRHDKTQYDEKGKISEKVLKELADAGYWGLLIDKEYGGQGVSVRSFMSFLTRVATIEPTVAGLASVHGCIGAVDPVRSFGNDAQKKKFLPRLASGESLSAFALTEPNAGSDLTALRTTATLEGDNYVLNGEKLFITNAIEGRTAGVVALVDGKPAALIVDLPKEQNESFQIVTYKLHALSHAHNNGLKFKNLKVPKENLLAVPKGDGLTVAYHGLNMGRLALCATASGVMRLMLANMLPWANFRETYGKAIETRELVKRRIARATALIAGSDALVAWGSWLLDQGYRGELECIIAKIFGSEAEKECAIELFMKTHGGRSFVQGHIFGDNVHDFLAPCIYEGEGEMLGMAFFKALAKNHGSTYFEPVGLALQKHGIRAFNPLNPGHAWALRSELMKYMGWYISRVATGKDKREVSDMDPRLNEHINFALEQLHQHPLELSEAMVTHQLKLPDRQCRIAEMSQRVQDTITILVTASWAHELKDKVMTAAADILCQDLTRKLTGERPSDSYYKACSKLADMVIEGEFKDLQTIEKADIIFSYEKNKSARNPVKAGV